MTSSTAPVLWFGAPSIATNSPNAAGQQFMTLFDSPSTWQVAAGQTYGFSLTESFILTATDAQLTEVFSYLKAHGMKTMMVAGMIPIQSNGIGNGVEGFTTTQALSQALNRIKSLGGTLDCVGMDAPLVAGCISFNGPQLSVTALAQQMAPNVALVKSFFPSVQFEVGDGTNTTSLIVPFQQAFQAATGSTIAQFDADVNWNLADNSSQLAAFASAAQAAGALYGISGNATNLQPGNLTWTLSAEANVAAAEANPLTRPAFIHIGTWDAYPTLILPEGLSGTLAHVAAEIAQFSPLYTSGYLTGGSGVTVATTAPEQSYAGSAMDAVAGSPILVPGVRITASASAGMTFAAVITDVTGMLNATANGAGKVTGAGTGVLTLTGNLADINAELASLTYIGVAAGTDTIDVTTYDGVGLVDDHLISVAIAAPIAETVPAGMTAATLYQNIFGHTASAATLSAAQAAMSAGKTLAQVAAPWIAQGQATIEALYEQGRGVSPTVSVLTSLTASLMGGQTVAQIRSSLASCAATQSELSAVYQNHYGVAPTTAQLAALTQQLASGTSLEDVEAPLLANSQAEAQVTTLFQQIEGVAPGATDLVTDARALLTGTSLSTLRGTLAASAVVQNNLSTLYQHVYDATPTAAQLASLTTQLSGGTTYAQIQAQFTATAQSEVTSIYQSVLNRSPSSAELSSYTQLLLAGSATILSIDSNLAYSTASVANVTSMYQQVIGQTAPQTVLTALEQCLCIGPNQIPLTQLRTDLANAATMYQQITGQTATADALTPLIYDYLNHASTTQIRTSLAYSASAVTMLRNTYQQLFGTGITAATLTNLEQALVNGTTTMAGINASLAAQAAADVPTISGVATSQTVTANSRVLPFGAVVIADPGTNALETVTVTLTGSGTLAGGGGGTLNAAHTAYTVHSTPAIVAAGLESLIFTPPTTGGSSQLTLTVQNGVGNHTSDTVAITSETLKSPTATMFLYAPTQSATLPSLFANETIVFPAGGFGVDTITGFSLAQGVIQLPHAIAATFAAVQSHETASAGGTLISFGVSESIFLGGIAPSSLHASNFAFA